MPLARDICSSIKYEKAKWDSDLTFVITIISLFVMVNVHFQVPTYLSGSKFVIAVKCKIQTDINKLIILNFYAVTIYINVKKTKNLEIIYLLF